MTGIPSSTRYPLLDARYLRILSIRFGASFYQSPEFWHGLQVECDFRLLAKNRKRLTAKIQTARQLVAESQRTAA